MDLFFKYGKKISPLDKYKLNLHSQNGEDGILSELLKRIKATEKISVVEFGAWDGIYLSNTFSLVEKGARAIFIEGDGEKFKDLLRTCEKYSNITPVLAFVEKDSISKNSLDSILKSANCIKDFDILSIDIDSYDLDIWESLSQFEPKIVVIEINSQFKPGKFIRHSQSGSGNSFSSTVEVGNRKGYVLVAHIGNLIFVRKDLIDLVGLPECYISDQNKLFNNFWADMPFYIKFYDHITSFIMKKILRIK